MYNIKLAGLDTGRTYYVKVRAKVSGYETSEWSMPFKFETPMDTMPPGRPENVSFISEGDSFIAKWQAPQFNEDGSNCGDISHYRLIFKDLDRNITREERAVDTSFTMDFNRNVQIFGSAAGRIELTVSAVDLSGNEGKNVAVIAQNPPPAKVQNVSASVGVESIGLKWDENTENDLANYEVHVGSASGFTPSSSTLRAKVAPGTNTHSYDTASLTMLYFKIIAVDKFNQKSTPSDVVSAQPRLTTDYDKTPPGAVAGLTVTQSLMPDNANAVAKVTYTGLSDADLDKYEIQYRKTGETIAPWSFATIPSDQTSAEIKPLPLSTSYDFKIRAVDFNSNKGAWSSVVVAPGVKKTSLPPAPTNVIARGGMTNLMVTWTESSDPAMANWAGVYEVHVAKTPTFSNPSVIKTSSTLTSLINLDANTVYYVRVRSIDPFDNIGPWSNVESENTGEVESGGNKSTFETTDPTGTGHTDGDIWYKVDAEENIIGMWEFFGNNWIRREIKNLADDSVTSGTISADAVLAGHIKAGEIEGSHLKANTALINDLSIRSSLTIDSANGHIKSSNYNANGSAGFYMDQQQLIINQGKIKAAAIELQDSANIMPPLYASFNANASAYTVAKLWSGSLSGTTKVVNDGKFGGGSVQFVITSNTGFVGMGTSGTDLTIPIEGGNQYIISFYVSNRSSKVITLQPELYQTSAITIKGTATSIANTTAWRRYSVVVTAPASMTRAILRFNLTAGATATFKLDGIQVEQKTGAIDTPSNWSPPGYTSIDGESITTGEISSNQTINTGNGAIAKWSINTQGDARFGDVTVDGQLIVGKSSYSAAQNANTSVKSDNYVAGTEGWAIKGNGDVEFNNGTFRGMLSLEKADLSMKASVSPIEVFSSPSQSTTIDAAHIRGVTYSYNRELKAGTEDTHYPTTPRLDRKGNFFIGPTTDRSVNIQVHDDAAEDAVYLGDTPSNVSITALNIGEQTDPASPPAVREDQGLSFRAQRTEERNYSYTGGDTEQENVSRILSGVSSTVKLRSPLYPESDDGLDMYPESSNVLQSVTDYSVPKNKNLLPSGEAVGWTFNPLMRDSIQGAAIQPEFGSSINAGDGRMASIEVTPFSSSKYVRIAPFSPIAYTSGKRHIASFYVNSEEASSEIYFGLKSGGMFLSPTEPANASLPAATDIYSTTPPGDYWPLTSNWLNTGASKGMSNIDHFSGGTPSFVNGAVNLAAGQRIRASGTKANHFTGGGTVSFWFKPATTGNTGECNMYHRGVSSSVNKEMWVILNGTTNRLQGGIALTGTARFWESTTTITSGEWHHIAIVIGPSTTNRVFQVYINGVQEVNTTFTSITGGFDTGQYLHLGADRNLTQQFTGQIGDVAHWETAANPQDIANIHASPRSAWPSDSFTGSQVAVVPPGQKAHRVSFWSDSLSSSSSPAITAIQSGIPAKFNLFAFQLEEAAYKDDMSLSAALRDSKRPTAWSVSNLDVRSSAKISVETKPVVNFLDYVESTKAVLPNQRSGLNIEPPAQITFDVGSRFSDDYAVTEGVFSGDMFTADASYKMSSKGFSYPGSPQPFMPTALDLHYDFTNLALTSRPRLGGTGYLFLGLNNQELGGVRYGGEGIVIKDNFDYPKQDTMPSPWQVVGGRAARISGNRAYLAYDSTTLDGQKYVYHGHEFQSHNQTASCTVEGTQGIGWRYGYGGPMISINPIKGDRIHLVVLNNSDPTWRLVGYKNNVKTTLRSGSFTGTRTGIPVIKLSRTGNTITGWYNNTQLFTQTFTDTQLPQGGRFAGFAANVGYMDNYIASRSGADAAANGEIQPYSFNINNGRGLKVITDYEVIDSIPYRVGEIHVLAPGYYTMTVTVRAESLGNAQADDFWMDLVDYRDIMGRENRTIQLSNQANQSNGSGAGAYLTGNATAYIEGRLEFRMFTDDTSVNRINRIEITVVRVA